MNVVRTLCDRVQGKAPKGKKRAPSWSRFRKRYIAAIGRCEICARKRGLEAHHIIPFHIAPDLELNTGNLIALCRRCHLFVGHLGSWQKFNVSVVSDAVTWRVKMEGDRPIWGKSREG